MCGKRDTFNTHVSTVAPIYHMFNEYNSGTRVANTKCILITRVSCVDNPHGVTDRARDLRFEALAHKHAHTQIYEKRHPVQANVYYTQTEFDVIAHHLRVCVRVCLALCCS